MIPKIIHYCWFGSGNMPSLTHKCIESWKMYLPDYELRLWNEDNFDVNHVRYVREAYQARKFAFVTDYVRLYALYHCGGIYMDTDVEVLKALNSLLDLPFFMGYESDNEIGTSIIGSQSYFPLLKELLQYYEKRLFKMPNNTLDITTNVEIFSGIMALKGFELKNSNQVFQNSIHIFHKDYFCPKTRAGAIHITENTYCIHHFDGSWQGPRAKIKKFIFRKIVGIKATEVLVELKRKLLKAFH